MNQEKTTTPKTYIEEILLSLIDLEKAMMEKPLAAEEFKEIQLDIQYILLRMIGLEAYLRLM